MMEPTQALKRSRTGDTGLRLSGAIDRRGGGCGVKQNEQGMIVVEATLSLTVFDVGGYQPANRIL